MSITGALERPHTVCRAGLPTISKVSLSETHNIVLVDSEFLYPCGNHCYRGLQLAEGGAHVASGQKDECVAASHGVSALLEGPRGPLCEGGGPAEGVQDAEGCLQPPPPRCPRCGVSVL